MLARGDGRETERNLRQLPPPPYVPGPGIEPTHLLGTALRPAELPTSAYGVGFNFQQLGWDLDHQGGSSGANPKAPSWPVFRPLLQRPVRRGASPSLETRNTRPDPRPALTGSSHARGPEAGRVRFRAQVSNVRWGAGIRSRCRDAVGVGRVDRPRSAAEGPRKRRAVGKDRVAQGAGVGVSSDDKKRGCKGSTGTTVGGRGREEPRGSPE